MGGLDVFAPVAGDILIYRFELGIQRLLDEEMTAHGLRIAAFHQKHPTEVRIYEIHRFDEIRNADGT